DDAAAGTEEQPLRTIGAGIRRAAASGDARRVCVAGGASCPATFDYPEAGAMVDGVSVVGGFEARGRPWPREGGVTRLGGAGGRGVVFDASVASPTVLDGFTVVGGSQTENAAVTIEGSTGAVLSNDVVQGGGGTKSFGVQVVPGPGPATPRIQRSTIIGGRGT